MLARTAQVVAAMLAVLAPSAAAQGSNPIGALQGVVRSSAGVAIVGAEVTIESASRRTMSAADGRYALVGIPAGRVQVMVRRVGYSPLQVEVAIPGGGALQRDFELSRVPLEMTPVVVSERREPFDARLAGFRQRAENPSSGHIFTRERIEQTSNRSALDLMRSVPGVRIIGGGRVLGVSQSIRFRGNRCPPVVFIDGHAASATEFDLSTLDLNMVEGVEVYMSSSTLPAEFFAVANGLEQCGVIAVWSRPAQRRPPRVRRPAAEVASEARESALRADQVDEAAYTLGGEPEIVYPDSMWQERTTGKVRLEFVVDSRGRMDWATLLVVEESHPHFTQAVMEALAAARWEPARKDGRRVAQLVVLPVEFEP